MKDPWTQKHPVANCGLGNIEVRQLDATAWMCLTRSSAARPISVCHQSTARAIGEQTSPNAFSLRT